jgi:ADP-L-glycero-D-manno-heptose 6-epimerase
LFYCQNHNLAIFLQDNYPEAKIVVFDAFVMGHFKNLVGFKGELISGDIGSKKDLSRLDDYKFDFIFHQAAISDTTVLDQKLVTHINTNAFKDILDIAVKHKANIVYASSAGTYGNSPAPNSVGVGEIPENVYGFSKLMMDNTAKDYMIKHPEISIVGLRYFNVYGPREVYKGKTSSMILQLGLQILAHQKTGKKPRLFKWGEQKRDFVYIEDVVQANVLGAVSKKSGIFNVGSAKARMFNEVLGILHQELDIFTEIEYFDNPYSFYQNHTQADISSTNEILGYQPRFELEDGIKKYVPEIVRIYETEL